MKAIIHIGTEKTGTSTIQAFLEQNRNELKKQGAAFLQSPGSPNNRKVATYCMNDDNIDDHVRELGITTAPKRRKWRARFKKSFVREIQSLDANISTIIISSEHFHSRLKTTDEVNNLRDLLTPYFDEVKIVVYLRRQEQVCISLYSTWCRVGATHTHVLDDTVSADDPYYNYYDLIERWAGVFGKNNIIIRIFDKTQFVNGDLLQDFFQVNGWVNHGNFVIPPSSNEKLSAQVQQAIVLFNAAFPCFDAQGRAAHFNNRLRFYVLTELEKKHRGQTKLPTKQEALAFYEKFSESNKRLARKYLAAADLFSNDFSMYPDAAVQASMDEAVIGDMFFLISEFMSQSNRNKPDVLLNKILPFIQRRF